MNTKNIYFLAIFFFCYLGIQSLSVALAHAKDRRNINETTRIVYAHGKKKHSNIFTIKPDGSDRRQLTDTSAHDWEAVWLPDGTGLKQLTHNTAVDRHPAWSPDGKNFFCEQPGLLKISTVCHAARRITVHKAYGPPAIPCKSPELLTGRHKYHFSTGRH